jgi:hypothetical protein
MHLALSGADLQVCAESFDLTGVPCSWHFLCDRCGALTHVTAGGAYTLTVEEQLAILGDPPVCSNCRNGHRVEVGWR